MHSFLPLLARLAGACTLVTAASALALEPDADADGVADLIDACPGTAPGVHVDATGCAAAFGRADVPAPGVPRFQVWMPPTGVAESFGGEYSIGFNPKTGNIMTMSLGFGSGSLGAIELFSGPIFRVTPPERLAEALPQACDAQWQDKSNLYQDMPQGVSDPILWTDQDTGRTFAADLTTGPNPTSQWAYSDDDGETWLPAGLGIAGADHETVVSGPYPEGSPFELVARTIGYGVKDATGNVVKGKAVYFCSQDVLPGTCIRSDDGGNTWSPPQLAYNGTGCNNLHGHLHIAPDGSAYLPVKHCGGQQGGSYSTDAGLTWNEFTVPDTSEQPDGSDPSIAIDDAGKLYFCYVDGDGHAKVRMGTKDASGNLDWGNDPAVDLGAAHGITNATFPEAVGGDAGRAACGFVGTNDDSPNYQSRDFKGVWYLYIATTYDGGATWTTVNATPNDPVQGAGGVWQQGGSGDTNNNRNLLDFNEITLDDHGRVLFGYNDGCVRNCDLHPDTSPTYVASMRVARQTGGRTLRAAFDRDVDASTVVEPGQACLTGTRSSGSHLKWKAPDHGGAAIVKYQVYSLADGQLMHLGDTAGTVTTFDDLRATAGSARYVVKAVNASGLVSDVSNEVLGPGEAFDLTPDAFGFADVTGVATHSWVTSTAATLTGFAALAPISITGGQYSVDDGAFTNQPGEVRPGSVVRVRLLSANAANTATVGTLTVGDVTAAFRAVTGAKDTTPAPFAFKPQFKVAPGVLVVSNTVTLGGFNAPAPITAGSGTQYRIDSGAWTSAAGKIQAGHTLQVRHRSSSVAGGKLVTDITVGGIVAGFSTTTR